MAQYSKVDASEKQECGPEGCDSPTCCHKPPLFPDPAAAALTPEQIEEGKDHMARVMLKMAYEGAAKHSHDERTQNGALLMGWSSQKAPNGSPLPAIVLGVNHFPSSIKPRQQSPEKYSWIVHAEVAAILEAAKSYDVNTRGATLFCPWAACGPCALAMVTAGIKTLVRHKDLMDKTPERWREGVALGDSILKEGGVEIIEISGKVGAAPILFNGEPWEG